MTNWQPDASLPGFETRRLMMPDRKAGMVPVMLVRRRAPSPSRQAVLYIHGFADYFFQTHMAERFLEAGFHFYALDLRRHGRSLQSGQWANYTADIREYDDEIDAAIEIICSEDGVSRLLLNGHSTGGLIAALYTAQGRRKEWIDALFLNSPFFGFNRPDWERRLTLPIIAALSMIAPGVSVSGLGGHYGRSIHRDHHGEWDFQLPWKPLDGFPARAGWVNAIHRAQQQVAAGLHIRQPILLMHSARSLRSPQWSEEMLRADTVLNIADMQRVATRLGPNVRTVAIEGGLHDLMLSPTAVRTQVFDELFRWLAWQ